MSASRTDDATCRCGGRLALVRRLEGDELSDVVVRWPEGAVVDVRACDTCGTERACLRRTGERAQGARFS